MARNPGGRGQRDPDTAEGASLGSGIDEMLLAAVERGDESLMTGRYIVTYKEDATSAGLESFRSAGVRTVDARDFDSQSVTMQDVGDADALVLPEIGVAVVTGAGIGSLGLSTAEAVASDSPVAIVEPEYFAFADDTIEYLRGFRAAVDRIAIDLGAQGQRAIEDELDAEVLGATWGLNACRVPQSTRSGAGIRVAILDTGLDLTHPDFAGRPIASASFVGQPVQDLYGHGTHCTGTACGTRTPPGTTPRYGIAFGGSIFIGKVLSNTGSGSSASVLAGMNWAIANNCQVISMSLGSQSPVQAAYTQAGQTALSRGLLIVAAAGNFSITTGAPANSPTIMSVASLDPNLTPSSFSNFGKIEIAGPGRDVFSSWPMPVRYKTISGTSMATPHVAGCAALLAQTNPLLRGQALWNRLRATCRPLPLPVNRVGSGLVQAAP